MKHLSRIPAFLTALAWLATSLFAGPLAAQGGTQRTAPWPAGVLEQAEHLPIQDAGRVKPFNTYASFLALRLNGKRTLETPNGEKLKPTAWLLDVVFFPEQAADYEVFMVQDSAVIDALGLQHDGKRKRDHYSLRELAPGLEKLFGLARQYRQIQEKQRTTLQAQIVALAHNVDEYSSVAGQADFARAALAAGKGDAVARIFDGRESVSVSGVVAKGAQLAALDLELAADPSRTEDRASLAQLHQQLQRALGDAWTLALYPPRRTAPADTAWLSPAEVVSNALTNRSAAPEHLEMLAAFERAAHSTGDLPAFERAFGEFASKSIAMADARGEFEKVDLEVSYYKADLLTKGLVFFLLAFVLAAAMWLAPRAKLLYAGTGVAALVGLGCLIAAIVVRCMIRERPPVSTLYETILFVTAVGGIAALIMEWINRQRLALSAAVVMGALGLFLAGRYEELDKRDTMPQLVAVLDTNFWLATHVTAITIGYSAGLLAALLANANLIAGFFTRRAGSFAPLRKSLARMTYGVLCFGLIFSVVGTILGGIWANESWGRFWGWDPKENGALLICLAQIVILHARQGGYLRDFGIAMATAFQGTVIAFSWFGVNLLGVGLHSYGFTSGIHTALWSYYLGQWGLVGIAGAHYLWLSRAATTPAPVAAVGPSTDARKLGGLGNNAST